MGRQRHLSYRSAIQQQKNKNKIVVVVVVVIVKKKVVIVILLLVVILLLFLFLIYLFIHLFIFHITSTSYTSPSNLKIILRTATAVMDNTCDAQFFRESDRFELIQYFEKLKFIIL